MPRNMETDRQKKGSKVKHLLWALLFLKVYATDTISAALAGCCECTFRKWVWPFVEAIGDVKNDVV